MLKKKFVLQKLKQLLFHIMLWFGVLFFYSYFFGVGSKDYQNIITFSLFLMPITIATTYTSIYKLIPEYLIKKRYWRFTLYSIYTLIISSYLITVSIFFSLIFLTSFEYEEMYPVSRNLLYVITGVYLVTIIVSAFKLLKLNLENTSKTSKLEKKILETQLKLKEQELNHLKMQIHPHFLFNTLNTMYGFALKKADETPEMILKLSNLLDYLLYQVDKPFVPLIDEIKHIEDYIELERLRFNNTLDVSFNRNTIPETVKIAPMLLIPFIENSFKHGIIKNGKLSIGINLEYTKDAIRFQIENSSSDKVISKNGIGLENIKKRLDMLYKYNHTLAINNNKDLFTVDLNLKTI